MVSPLYRGANALGPYPLQFFDVDAFEALYGRANRSGSAFEHEVIDEALDDLVARPVRQASGQRLASNLRRTARQRLLDRPRPIVSSDVVEKVTDVEGSIASPEAIMAQAAAAAALVAQAVDDLSSRSRRALRLTLTHGSDTACRALGVRKRQLRHIIAAARAQINDDPGAVVGFETLNRMFATNRWAAASAVVTTFGDRGDSV